MLGRRKPQRSLFEAHCWPHRVPTDSFYARMGAVSEELFRDEDLASMYCEENGRPSLPPSLMSGATLLQFHDDVSDEEAVDRMQYDIRWKVALNLPLDFEPPHPSSFSVYRHRRWPVRELAERLHLRWRQRLGLRAKAITVYSPKYGTLRLVVTRNRHGNYEYIASNDLTVDLTTLVLRKRSRWSIETVFRDTKQFAAFGACQARVDQALVRHVAFALVTFTVLQVLRRHPEETLGAVRERLQLQVLRGNAAPPATLRAKAALL